MNNETYLKASYVFVTLICLFLGLLANVLLKRSVEGIAQKLPQGNLKKLSRRAFPLSIILFVLSACLSVDYYGGCKHLPYDKIVENRDYIVSKNLEQVSSSLEAIAFAVSLWCFLILLSLLAIQRANRKSASR